VSRSVKLTFQSTRYGRSAQSSFTVAYTDWDESVASWLWPAVRRYEKKTALAPSHLTEWDSLRHALPGLASVFSWRTFTSIPVQELEVDDVRDLFMDIDDTFHLMWGADVGALRSSRARKFLLDHLFEARPDGKLTRVKGSFSPKGRANHQPRRLISDQVLSTNEGNMEPPIGALPHANASDLKARTKKRLVKDLEQIANACGRELDAYFKACELLHRIRSQPIDAEAEASALDKITLRRGRLATVAESLSPSERRALIAHYLRLDNEPTAPVDSPNYAGSSFLAMELSSELGIAPDVFLRCARYQYYPHQTVLVAAIILIQLASAWNVGSVMELTSKGITPLGRPGEFLLQSTKTKTGDDTPSVLIEGADDPGVRAVQFALGRLQALKDRGWAESSETGLWLSPRSNRESSRGLPISNLSKGLEVLRDRYGLPHFTFEQIRVQKLTVVSLERGPIAAAEMAGHSTFQSIGGYIDHALTRRVNSSVNLEFQRRWESEVLARIEMRSIEQPLVPIGDGSSCTRPSEPPEPAWLQAGVCDGSYCHAGGGCPNRVVVLTRERVEEVLLTKAYYEKNWQRLHASNPEAFGNVHMPRMEFNIYLHEHLRKGPYRHLLNG
jgi:hypothetical protein